MANKNLTTKSRAVILALMMVVSVMAVPLAFSGAALADEHDTTLEDGNIHWQGQVLEFTDASVEEGDELVLRVNEQDNSNLQFQYVADENGAIHINTSNLEHGVGNYELTGPMSEPVNFELASQNLSVDADNDSVVNAESGSENQTEFEFDSNRASYDVYVSEEDDSFDMEELDEIFQEGAEVTVDDEDYYQIQSPDEVTAVFAEVDAGEYTFDFEVVDTDASASSTVEVREIGDVDASFVDSPYTETVGNVAEYTVETTNTNEISLQIGGESVGYQYNFDVDVSDESDSTVTVLFDTTQAGTETVPVELGEDSDGTLMNADADQNLTNALATGSYALRVSADGSTQDVTNLRLVNRSTDDSATHTAPETESISEVEDIADFATETDMVAMDDKLLFEVNATGLYANLNDNTTAADLVEGSAYAQANGTYVTMEELNPGVNQRANEIDVSQADLVVDDENERFFLVFDVGDLDVEDEDEYELEFVVDENNPYVEEDEETGDVEEETVASSVTFTERMVEFDGVNEDDVVVVENSSETVVTATTTVAPQTEVRGVAESDGSPAFFLQNSVEVSEDRTLEFTFNMEDIDDGAEFTLAVDGFEDSEVDAVTSSTETVEESNVTVDVVDADSEEALSGFEVELLSDGAAVQTAETDEEGSVTFESVEEGTYTVEPVSNFYEGSAEVEVGSDDVSVTLEVTELPTYTLSVDVEDENGNAVEDARVFVDNDELTVEDSSAEETVVAGDYTVSASADGFEDAEQNVTVDDEDVNVTMTLVEESTDDGQADDGQADDGQTDDGETEDDTPGFGALVALVALIAAALLAVRRTDNN